MFQLYLYVSLRTKNALLECSPYTLPRFCTVLVYIVRNFQINLQRSQMINPSGQRLPRYSLGAICSIRAIKTMSGRYDTRLKFNV